MLPDVPRHIHTLQELFAAFESIVMDRTGGLNLVNVANNFIASNDHRKYVFDTDFKPSDQLRGVGKTF